MKKILGIVVLGLLWCNVGFAGNLSNILKFKGFPITIDNFDFRGDTYEVSTKEDLNGDLTVIFDSFRKRQDLERDWQKIEIHYDKDNTKHFIYYIGSFEDGYYRYSFNYKDRWYSEFHGIRLSIYPTIKKFNDLSYGKYYDKEENQWVYGVYDRNKVTKHKKTNSRWFLIGYDKKKLKSHYRPKLTKKERKEFLNKLLIYENEWEDKLSFVKELEATYYDIALQFTDDNKISNKRKNIIAEEKRKEKRKEEERIAEEKRKEEEIIAEEKRKEEERIAEEKRIAEEFERLEAKHIFKCKDFAKGTSEHKSCIYDAEKEEERKIALERKLTEIDPNLIPIATGTGFFVSKDGYVVTNAHVAGICELMQITIIGKKHYLNVVETDDVNDLGLLKGLYIHPNYLELDIEGPNLGEDILTMGYPLGEYTGAGVKISKGIVSSLSGPGNNYSEFQHDAAVAPGSSGGPVINKSGHVVGVVYGGLDKIRLLKEIKHIPEGINFAVSSQTLTNFLKANKIKYLKAISNEKLDNENIAQIGDKATVKLFCLNTKEFYTKLKKAKSHSDILLNLK